MKILYVASERSRAQVATRALRAISPNVTVLWGSSYERAAFTILENPDLAALVVEVQSDTQGSSYLKQLQTLGLQAPVVMVLPEGAGSPTESIKAGANDYIAKGPSFSQELPAILTRTISRAETPESPVVTPADRRTTQTPQTERRARDLEPSHQQEHRWAVEQSATAGRQARLEMLLHQEREMRTSLELKLTDMKAALQQAEGRHASAVTAAAQQAERNAQYERGMARAASTQKMLEEQLRQARQNRISAAADVERLTLRNAELSSMLTEATATRKALEGRLATTETALEAANDRASSERSGADEQSIARQAELQAQLEREVAKRRSLEDELARAKRAYDEAEKQRSSVVTAATALWNERQAQFETELAAATEVRNTLGRDARQLEGALEQARQTIEAQAATVDRLRERESELASQLAEADAIRTTLEHRLQDATTALKDADEGASRNRLAAATRAAERELELEGLVRQERASRADVEQRLAHAEAALRDAEQQHTSAMTMAARQRAEREAQLDSDLANAAETRNTLNLEARQLATEVARLTQRESELTAQLADAAAARRTLEQQLTAAADALAAADTGASRDRLAAEARTAERTAEFDRLIRQERAARADVEGRLTQVEAALRDAEQQHASTMAAAAGTVDRLTQRESELTAQLADAAAARRTLEQQLAAASQALSAADKDASVDRLAAEARTAEFDRLIRQERAARADVEGRLTQVEAALRDAEQQHASAMSAAARERAEREAQSELELSQMAATRDEFKRRYSDAEAALAAARQDHAAAATEIDRRAQRERALTSQLDEAAAMRSDLEQQLTDATTALRDATESANRDRRAWETTAAERAAEFDRLIGQERAARADVEGRLAHVEAALRDAEQEHTSAMAAAATERARRQAQFDDELAQVAEARDTFDRRARELASKVERLTERETALTSQLVDAAAMRSTLEQQLTDAATALRDATEAATRDRRAWESTAAERAAEFDRLIGQERAARADVEGRLTQVETAFRDAEQEHTAAIAAAATERAERQAQFENELAQVEAALHEANQQHTAAMAAAATERAERQAQFDSELAQVGEARDTLAHQARELASKVEHLTQREATLSSQLAQVEAALREANQQHTAAMAAAATERAERQAQFELELSQTAAARDEFERRFNDADTALTASRRDHAAAASEVERLTGREAALTSQLGEAAEMRSTLEQQLTDGAAALRDAHEGANRDRLAAETKAAEREAEFERLIGHERALRADVEGRLAQEIAHREALDGEVAQMRTAAADAEQRYREETAALTARGRHQVTQLESQFAKEREAQSERQARLLNDIQNLEAARGALDESLTALREESRLRAIDHQNERDALQRARSTAEAEIQRLGAELAEAMRTLEEARKNFQQTLDLVSSEHADSQAKLLASVEERDARIADVEKRLDDTERELRRQFQHAPLPVWRCTREGAFSDANQALAKLVGYRQPDELRHADFVKTVFESTDDLSWLIERCLATKAKESVETAWKRRSGEHMVVRLSAVECPPDLIEIAVEDVTNVRVLEDRLAHAHRMEAVARLASEIAITCGRLLGDVHQDGQQWLMEVSAENALRKRGDRLLGEIARAASYLERIAAHGDEQTSALKPVELSKVLRDLKPVLKHVAGDDVDIELSKTSSVLNVDMKADRVERLLVNLASYGRERMPAGGQLKIELATVVVDQKFIADHPNVRRGHHALITVTAMRREMPTATLHSNAVEPAANEVASEKPGVDLGALQELLQECGGHLWLTVDPPGNMVVKLRLPLRVWDDRKHSTTSDTPTSRKSVMGRWFRH